MRLNYLGRAVRDWRMENGKWRWGDGDSVVVVVVVVVQMEMDALLSVLF